MRTNKSKLEAMGFARTHGVEVINDEPRFVKTPAAPQLSKDPSVYLWVGFEDKDDSTLDVLYVGKAGAGVAARLIQHTGGFRASSTGRDNAQKLIDYITAGKSVDVYTRVSATHALFDVVTSLYSAEEEALIALLAPKWNRARVGGRREMKAGNDVEADFSDLALADVAASFFDSLDLSEKAKFAELLTLIQLKFPQAQQKIVGRYSNQPEGYNGVPMLVFAELTDAGIAVPNSWVARIPLVNSKKSPLTIIVPTRLLKSNLEDGAVRKSRIGDAACPANLDDFLKSPDAFIQ